MVDLLFYFLRSICRSDLRDLEIIVRSKEEISQKIIKYLENQAYSEKKCKICGKALPYNFKYGICENCYFILKSADKNCFNEGCKGTYIKANKFVREILSNLSIKCYGCDKDNIRYIDYLEHIKSCEGYLSNPILKKLVLINKKTEEIEKLKKEKEQLVKEARKRNMLSDQELRARYLTNKLQTTDKMNFYQAVIDGNLDAYKRYIQGTYGQPYNIFEEVSAPGYGWTTIHYAMHYAKWNIIKFIIEYLESQNKLEIGIVSNNKIKIHDNILIIFKIIYFIIPPFLNGTSH